MSNPTGKKPFSDPELVVYGDVRSITQNTKPAGMGDGGMGGLTKTA
ncbi:MAG TPA: hypothetical protein VM890_01455 [Longimicrobium sp.]|jgi:hypothetical protein|nr:hypothetical protein [Longimicrobium sp.]